MLNLTHELETGKKISEPPKKSLKKMDNNYTFQSYTKKLPLLAVRGFN